MTAIAIDDEPIALDIVKSHAAKVPFIELKAVFTNAFDALTYLQQNKTDLIFLDIKMPDISGIDFYNSLSKRPLLIFTTAYTEHAVTSFEMDAIGFSSMIPSDELTPEQEHLLRSRLLTPDIVGLKYGYVQLKLSRAMTDQQYCLKRKK